MSGRITPRFERSVPKAPKPMERIKPTRLPPKPKFNLKDYALPCFAVATGAMVGLSAPQLIDPVGWSGWLKIVVFTGGATLVSYIVNRHAVDDGADLAARGFLWAGFVSVSSILIVGGGLFASTYAGLTIKPVDDLRLQRHGLALAAYVEAVHAGSSGPSAMLPVISATVTDIDRNVACEIAEGCLSGRGRSGRGPVTRALEPVASRAREIAAQVEGRKTKRGGALGTLNESVTRYQSVAGDGSLARKDKRQQLSRIDSQIKQWAVSLRGSVPVSLLSSYAKELKSGIRIPGRSAATDTINILLARHGEAVERAVSSLKRQAIVAPEFPNKAGVSSTFSYLGHFIPIAALTAVIELVMPLTLWVYVLLGHIWRNYRNDPDSTPPSAPPPFASHGGHHVH